MNRKTSARRKIAAGMAALALFALLGGLLPLHTGAASYGVVPVGTEFKADVNGTETLVYRISTPADTGSPWTVKSVTAAGDTYQDADGNYYAPAGMAVTAVLTCTAVLLPTETVAATDEGGLSSGLAAGIPTYPSDSESDLTCTFTMGEGAASLAVTSAFVTADAAPVNGVASVTTDGVTQTYVFSGDHYLKAVTVTFTSSPYYTVSGLIDGITGTSSPFTLPLAMVTDGFPFVLNLNTASYNFPSDLSTIVTAYTVNGENLGTDSFTQNGTMLQSFLPPQTENTTVTITLDASQITPIVPDDDGGGTVQNKIRVENELNRTDISSDTTLWPSGTTEADGVSTTVVSDEELQALLDLAAKHAADTKALGGNGLKEGIFCIEDLFPFSKNNTYILSLTDPQFELLAQFDWARLTVQTPAGSFSLYPGTVRQTSDLTLDGSGGVQVILKRLKDETRPGLEATLTVNRSEVTVLDETYGIRIFIPYVPAEGEDINALVIEYIHEDGTKELVTECSYDEEMGGLVFFVCHLSKFGVTYRPATFSDVGPKQWSNPYVTFLVSRGVLTGSSDGKFRPDDAATRGAFLTVITRALSATKLPASATQTYGDVAASSALAKVSNWIYYNNLASDIVSGGKLRPSEAITREDAALLVNNVALGMGLRVRSKGMDSEYTDAGQIADYARQAVTRLRSAGVLDMPQNQKFNPKATLNRGEMAELVALLLSNL